jgi:hypothetical protein
MTTLRASPASSIKTGVGVDDGDTPLPQLVRRVVESFSGKQRGEEEDGTPEVDQVERLLQCASRCRADQDPVDMATAIGLDDLVHDLRPARRQRHVGSESHGLLDAWFADVGGDDAPRPGRPCQLDLQDAGDAATEYGDAVSGPDSGQALASNDTGQRFDE